jgi:tartrate dehydratase alpha subunit/fumarate hydratase class I-like protein
VGRTEKKKKKKRKGVSRERVRSGSKPSEKGLWAAVVAPETFFLPTPLFLLLLCPHSKLSKEEMARMFLLGALVAIAVAQGSRATTTCDLCIAHVFSTQQDPITNITIDIKGQWCFDSNACVSQAVSAKCGDNLPYATEVWECACAKKTSGCKDCVDNADPTQACVWCDEGCYFQQYSQEGSWDELCAATSDACDRQAEKGITGWVLWVIISAAAAVCLCILIAIGVVVWRKKKAGGDGGNYY